MSTRRQFLTQASVLTAGGWLAGESLADAATKRAAKPPQMRTRPIPSSGKPIPVIGLGTSGSFEVPPDSPQYQSLKEVLKRFFAGGGTVIDTAPTYGNAEEILGQLLKESGLRSRAFIATKLSKVTGREQGLEQFNRTLQSLQTDKVELLQVHNLIDWKTQLEVARELKAQGKVKYVGLTHYLETAQDRLADAVEAGKPDFLQINYSATHRGAERRLLPMAQQLGVAVLANRNFNDGAIFERVKDKALPGWAAEVGVTSWAQMFLKFALSHEAITAVIPATDNPEYQTENLQAGFGMLLNAEQKKEIVELVS